MPHPLTIPSAWQNPSFPGEYTKNYFQGAVEFFPGAFIQGASGIQGGTTSFCGVISYWVNFGTITATTSLTHINQPGPNGSTFSFDPSGVETMNSYILQSNNASVTEFPIGLTLADGLSGNTLINAWVFVPGNPTPTGWHHCIWSWDANQTNVVEVGSAATTFPVLRAQFAYDRGGTPADGGGVYDTILGCNDLAQGGSPQPMIAVSGTSSFLGNTGIIVATGLPNEWIISADDNTDIGYAYCYAAFCNSFFDLTYIGTTGIANLDQFITGALAPVNLGFGGVNPTNQQTGDKLIPLFMHTGNALSNIDVAPAAWDSGDDYKTAADLSLAAWVEYPENSNTFYVAIQDSGPSFGGGRLPTTSPTYWMNAIPPFGRQFTINGVDGLDWPNSGGDIGNAPTQPDTGA